MIKLTELQSQFDLSNFEVQLINNEGLKLSPYVDTVGKKTIGIGWNIDDRPIRTDEAILRMRNDIKECKDYLKKYYWFERLNLTRQNVLIEMVFNLGQSRFEQFNKMISELKSGDFKKASEEMLNSKWATQVKGRAILLSKQMETGLYEI